MITVNLGNVSLNMGTQSFTGYQLQETPGSLDISYFNMARSFIDNGFTFVSPTSFPSVVTLRSGGYDLTSTGEFSVAGNSPPSFSSFIVNGFELKDNANAGSLVVSMSFGPGLDLTDMVNATFADPESAHLLID